MRHWYVWAAAAVLALPQVANAACAKCMATRVTTTNAAKLLFGGLTLGDVGHRPDELDGAG